MKNTLPTLVVGVLIGLLIAWLLGLFSSTPATAAASATVVASNAANSSAPVKLIASAPAAVIKSGPTPTVAQPVVAPAQVAHNAPAPTATTAAPAVQTPDAAQIKAITNNLRQLAGAGQQYMLDQGVTSVNYFDLTSGPDDYLRNVNPVVGEDYTGFSEEQDTTEISILTPDGTVVTFDE